MKHRIRAFSIVAMALLAFSSLIAGALPPNVAQQASAVGIISPDGLRGITVSVKATKTLVSGKLVSSGAIQFAGKSGGINPNVSASVASIVYDDIDVSIDGKSVNLPEAIVVSKPFTYVDLGTGKRTDLATVEAHVIQYAGHSGLFSFVVSAPDDDGDPSTPAPVLCRSDPQEFIQGGASVLSATEASSSN